MIYNHITIKKRRVLKKIGKFSLSVVLALALMLSNSVMYLSAFEAHVVNVTATIERPPDSSACPFRDQPNRTIVNFDGGGIRSDKTLADATKGPVSAEIPAGLYDITLASYDDHSNKPGQIQPQEQWHLILKNSYGNNVAITPSISDLPDNLDALSEQVASGFAVSEAVASMTAFHSAYPINNPNSIVPVCGAFDRVGDPPPPPPDPSVCPFKTEPGKTVINFNSGSLTSNKTQSEATAGPVFGYVPAGSYDITLVSYDDHAHKPVQIQPQEQWYLILKDGDSGLVAETSAISDLPSDQNQIIEKVETGFTLSRDTFFATAFHDAYPINNPNSIIPLCAVFEGELGGSEFALPASLMPPPSGRVEDGLLVLYTFEEEDGRVIKDVSGVGEPLHLWIADESVTSKVFGGLSIASSTIISDLVPPMKIINGVKAAEAITIEAWVKPKNTTQGGPARIATLSKNPDLRDFTLSQSTTKYDTRLRTTATSNNGIPSISTPEGTVTTDLTHVVYARNASGTAKMYVNGAEEAGAVVGGSVSNWDASFRFALANEFTMNRTWLGELHLVAIYNKALSALEVGRNFSAGADREIVINEFLPNPTGADDAAKPNGEWVELYNLSDVDIDVNGWYLYDSLDSQPVIISSANSDNNGNTADAGETVVPSHGYLVVYLDGAHSPGWLNNSGGDGARLYKGPVATAVLVDSYSYAGDAPENKSYARIPDGTGEFVDPIPTPLAPNRDFIQSDSALAESAESMEAMSVSPATFADDNTVEDDNAVEIEAASSSPAISADDNVIEIEAASSSPATISDDDDGTPDLLIETATSSYNVFDSEQAQSAQDAPDIQSVPGSDDVMAPIIIEEPDQPAVENHILENDESGEASENFELKESEPEITGAI